MEVLNLGAIPMAAVKVVIGEMVKAGNNVVIHDKKEGNSRPFWVLVPKHVAKKLEVGNTITVVCKPIKDLSFARETFALILHTSESSSQQLFDRDDYLSLIH